MPTYQEVHERIRTRPRTWLVTGVAGFIGSNLLAHAIDWYVAKLAPQCSTDLWALESRVVLHES
jgi:hypothetical protein